MSHSDNNSINHPELVWCRENKVSIASRLHNSIAQPLVAAKNYARAIVELEGSAPGLQEARELAALILQMNEEAFTLAYDLMRELETQTSEQKDLSLTEVIMGVAGQLRLESKGLQLQIQDNSRLTRQDEFLKTLVLDCVKIIVIYLARHSTVGSVLIQIDTSVNSLSLCFKLDEKLDHELLKVEIEMTCLARQLQSLAGVLQFSQCDSGTRLSVSLPLPLLAVDMSSKRVNL